MTKESDNFQNSVTLDNEAVHDNMVPDLMNKVFALSNSNSVKIGQYKVDDVLLKVDGAVVCSSVNFKLSSRFPCSTNISSEMKIFRSGTNHI